MLAVNQNDYKIAISYFPCEMIFDDTNILSLKSLNTYKQYFNRHTISANIYFLL